MKLSALVSPLISLHRINTPLHTNTYTLPTLHYCITSLLISYLFLYLLPFPVLVNCQDSYFSLYNICLPPTARRETAPIFPFLVPFRYQLHDANYSYLAIGGAWQVCGGQVSDKIYCSSYAAFLWTIREEK